MLMKNKLSFIIKMFILVIAASVFLAIFLVACYMVPLDEVNYALSIEEFDQEGWYSNVLELRPGYDQNFFSEEPGIQPVSNDRADYTRAAGLSEKGPLYNAMAMIDDEGNHYARYWHGYAGVIRLLLTFFDCKEIKFLSFIFQLFLLFMVAIAVYSKEGIKFVLLLITQYILLMPLAVSVSMVFAFSIDIALIGVLFYSYRKNRLENIGKLCYFFCVLGILTCFFEELVFGVLTWGIVIFWAIIFDGKNVPVKRNILRVVSSGLSWMWGYGAVWFLKWVFASVVMRENIILNGIGSVTERSSSNNSLDDVKISGIGRLLDRFNALGENYKYYCYAVFFAVLALWAIWLICKLCRSGMVIDNRIPSLGLIAIAPAVWYFILANHTLGHRFMTYRIWNTAIISVLAIIMISSEKRSSIKEKIRFKILVLSVSCLLSVICACIKTEGTDVRNLVVPPFEMEFSEFEGGIARTTLIPTFRKINDIGLIISPGSSDGKYNIRLLHDDTVLYEDTIAAEDFCESPWQMRDYDWKVTPGNRYELEIIPVFSSGSEGSITVCVPGTDRIGEMGYLNTIDKAKEVQLYTWLACSTGVHGRKWIFYFLTWLMVFVSIFLVCGNIYTSLSVNKAGLKENK